MKIAREAQHRYERTVSWGLRVGEHEELWTHVAAPVMTRLRQPQRQVLDTLVESGVARSRADALAWCVRLVGQHEEDWLAELREAMTAVDDVRSKGPAPDHSPRRRPLVDRSGDHHDGRPRAGRGPPPRAGRERRRDAARRPVERDRGAGPRPAPGAGGAAHRVGQVGGLLRRDAAPARQQGAGPDRDHLAAARADAQPDRGGRARRDPRGHHQLDQHRAVGADPRGDRGR